MDHKKIEGKVKKHVGALVKGQFSEKLQYHSMQHVDEVAEAATLLAEKAGLSSDQKFELVLAAWFHDVGYAQGHKKHEKRGVEEMRSYLRKLEVDEPTIERIGSLIMATHVDHKAANELEGMIKDADHCHFGHDNYLDRVNDLLEERRNLQKKKVGRGSFYKESIAYLDQHEFHTEAAKELWGDQKKRNRETLIYTRTEFVQKKREKRKKKRLDKASKETARGIETLFRTVTKNHVRFSEIADNKANIMLSINAIIISIAVTGLAPRLDEHPEFILPMTILILVCLTSVITATISTRPKVTAGKTSKELIEQKKANLLFFGNFHKMEVADYERGMWQVMDDREYLYGSMIKDLYYLGVVLDQKYRYLRITYNVFMYGLVLIILASAYAAYASSHV